MMNEQYLHDKTVEGAQMLLDQVISFFQDDPFLTISEKLSLVHELRSALDNAERDLLSSTDRPFHVDGHEERMTALKREMEAKRAAYLSQT